MIACAQAARAGDTALALLIDEVQFLNKEDLSALIVAVHRLGQKSLPLVFFGAGLPQLAALAGEAKSYAERLFDYPNMGSLTHDAAVEALREPVRRQGIDFADDAIERIVDETQRYPYFLQEWGHHA